MEEHKHEHGITCPMCGGDITADTEAELIKKFRTHAKDKHDVEKSDEEVRMMMEGSE